MPNEFLLALRRLQQVTEENAVEQVFSFFQSINSMDKPSIISAYQTFLLFKREVPLEDRDAHSKLAEIEKVMTDRMVTLIFEGPADKYQVLTLTFRTVVRDFCHRRFDDILERLQLGLVG